MPDDRAGYEDDAPADADQGERAQLHGHSGARSGQGGFADGAQAGCVQAKMMTVSAPSGRQSRDNGQGRAPHLVGQRR
jgi:hypothetical protein